jgi:hypothetical protein
MRKVILSIVALAATVSWDCATEHASADGIQAVHHARTPLYLWWLVPIGRKSEAS